MKTFQKIDKNPKVFMYTETHIPGGAQNWEFDSLIVIFAQVFLNRIFCSARKVLYILVVRQSHIFENDA